MTEYLPQNETPAAQRAKAYLRQLKAEVSPSHLYNLQLAIWGLENLTFQGWMADYQYRLMGQAEAMLGWKPTTVLPYLNPNQDQEEIQEELPEDWLAEAESAEEAAGRQAMALAENLSETFPSMGPPSELD